MAVRAFWEVKLRVRDGRVFIWVGLEFAIWSLFGEIDFVRSDDIRSQLRALEVGIFSIPWLFSTIGSLTFQNSYFNFDINSILWFR